MPWKRALILTIQWRVISLCTMAAILYIATGSLGKATSLAVITNIVLFFEHWVWLRWRLY